MAARVYKSVTAKPIVMLVMRTTIRQSRWIAWAAACVAVIASLPVRGDHSQSVGTEALAAFQQKCAACHGPEAKKPKKFAYVDDLARLAGNPKLVVPGDLSKSSLWQSIEDDEMPPEDAATGPLSDAQKQAIKR